MRAAVIVLVAALSGCSWARATFGDPPGPVRAQYPSADDNADEHHPFLSQLDGGAG